ncbi:hypothetical protein DEO72_LG1g1808 [Vigna unguiculata]|uniref:Uncharacterized protein n=1 Tax=Vigna unguiculata TaxID=3917 RepID=A0A4D6KJQ0_VIGUN|nr:hypothetical protein DEO72_LG1g1808 [Vigna unguiculata]
MGNSFNKYAKIELYKWSSSEFAEEYALVYTSLEDVFRSSTLRLSVDTDMVLCRLVGDMCKTHQVRCHVKISALRDSRGDCKFGEVVVSQQGDVDPTVRDDSAWFKFWCEDGGAHIFLKSTEQKLDRVMERTCWEFCYSFDVGDRRTLKYFVSIRCNKETGLSVGFGGPFLYKGVIFEEKLGLPSKVVVSGEPPKELTENAESEFKGKKYTLLKRDENGCTPPSGKAKKAINKAAQTVAVVHTAAQATGVINNIGGHTQGNFNGAVLNNVKFYGPQQLPRTVESNNSVGRIMNSIQSLFY